MDAHRLESSKPLRLAAAIAYAALLVWLLPTTAATGPILMIGLGLPLVFRLVPRNWLYGMRTPRTLLTTNETWYRQNLITGVAMVLIGVVWLAVLAVRR